MLAALLSAEFVFRAMLAPRMAELSERSRSPWADRAIFVLSALPMVLLISNMPPLEAVMLAARTAPERLVSPVEFRFTEAVSSPPIAAALFSIAPVLRAMVAPRMAEFPERSRLPWADRAIFVLSALPMALLMFNMPPLEAVMLVARRAPERLVSSVELRRMEAVSSPPMLAALVRDDCVFRAMVAPRMAELSERSRLPVADRAMLWVSALPMVLVISKIPPLEAVMFAARRAPERLVSPVEFRFTEAVSLPPMLAALFSIAPVFRAMAAPRMAEFSLRLRLPVADRAMLCVSALPMALLIFNIPPLEAVMFAARRAPERLVSPVELRRIEAVSSPPIAAALVRDDCVFRAMVAPRMAELSDTARLPWAARAMLCVSALPMVLLISKMPPLEAVMLVARRAPERLVSPVELRFTEAVSSPPMLAALFSIAPVLRAMVAPRMAELSERSRLPWADRAIFVLSALPMALLIFKIPPLEAVMFVARRAPERLVSRAELRFTEAVSSPPIAAALVRDDCVFRAMVAPRIAEFSLRLRLPVADRVMLCVSVLPMVLVISKMPPLEAVMFVARTAPERLVSPVELRFTDAVSSPPMLAALFSIAPVLRAMVAPRMAELSERSRSPWADRVIFVLSVLPMALLIFNIPPLEAVMFAARRAPERLVLSLELSSMLAPRMVELSDTARLP